MNEFSYGIPMNVPMVNLWFSYGIPMGGLCWSKDKDLTGSSKAHMILARHVVNAVT